MSAEKNLQYNNKKKNTLKETTANFIKIKSYIKVFLFLFVLLM